MTDLGILRGGEEQPPALLPLEENTTTGQAPQDFTDTTLIILCTDTLQDIGHGSIDTNSSGSSLSCICHFTFKCY